MLSSSLKSCYGEILRLDGSFVRGLMEFILFRKNEVSKKYSDLETLSSIQILKITIIIFEFPFRESYRDMTQCVNKTSVNVIEGPNFYVSEAYGRPYLIPRSRLQCCAN